MDENENKKEEIKEEKIEEKNSEVENNVQEESNTENSKSRFYKKFIWSVGKISKYPDMVEQGLKSAIKYFFIIIAIYGIILGIVETYLNIKLIDDVSQYLNTELPEFAYINNELTLENSDSIILDNSDFIKLFGFKAVVNTNLEKQDAINEYYELATENTPCVVILQNEYILITSDYVPEDEEIVDTENQEENNNQTEENQEESDSEANQESEEDPTGISTYLYTDFTTNNSLNEETEYNKQSLINYLESQNSGIVNYFVYFFIVYFGILTITFLFQIIIITLTAFVVSKVLKKNITFKDLFITTIYASTLAFTLYVIHSIVSYFTKFSIPYFYVIILVIAYLYVLFALDKMKPKENN